MVTGKPTASPAAPLPVPGEHLNPATMPAHWLLAKLGKKVMRPGGSALSDVLLAGLGIGPDDDVVDLAPALGDTVRRVEAAGPASFRGVERIALVVHGRTPRGLEAASTAPACALSSAHAKRLRARFKR